MTLDSEALTRQDNLGNWEDTQVFVDEETNTYIFPSPDCDSIVDHKVDDRCDVYQHDSQTSSDHGSTCRSQETERRKTRGSLDFKKPLRTYSRVSMRNSAMLGRTGRQKTTEPVEHNAYIATEVKNLEAFDTEGKTASAVIKDKKKVPTKGNIRRLLKKVYAFDATCNPVDGSHAREATEKMDGNVDGSEMETNSSSDICIMSVSHSSGSFEENLEIDVANEKENHFGGKENAGTLFTRVKSRNCKTPTVSSVKNIPGKDGPLGTPRTRAQKRKAPGTNLQYVFEAPVCNVQERSDAGAKRSVRSQRTLGNCSGWKSPAIQVEKGIGSSLRALVFIFSALTCALFWLDQMNNTN